MEKLADEMLQRLDLLAAKLGVATEHLWAVLCQQGKIEGLYGFLAVVIGIGMLAAGLWCMRALSLIVKRADDDCEDSIVLGGIFGMLGTVALIILGLVLMSCGYESTKYLFNPEYFAIREISKFL